MIVAGLGFRASATSDGFAAMLAGHEVTHLAVLAEKAAHPGLIAFAARAALPIVEIASVAGTPTLSCSPRIKARFGTGSLCEALAVSAGRNARLALPRQVSQDGTITLAIAKGEAP